MQTVPFKRGDTFLYNGALTNASGPVDLTNIDIRSQVRNGEVLLSEAVVTKVLPMSAGIFSLRVDDTTAWPAKVLLSDIQYTINGQVISSETFGINCTRDITRT